MADNVAYRIRNALLLGAGEGHCAAATHKSPVRLAPKQAGELARPAGLYTPSVKQGVFLVSLASIPYSA